MLPGSGASTATGRKVRTMLLSPAWRCGPLAVLQAMRTECLENAEEEAVSAGALGKGVRPEKGLRNLAEKNHGG
eukprot:s418_g3.t1